MGRGRFKAFIPADPPDHFVMPANGDLNKRWEKPVFAAPVTADDFKVDEASKQITYSTDRLLTPADHFVGVDTSSQAITITLPLSSTINSGKQLVIKDEGANAGTNNISIVTKASDSALIDDHQSIKITSDCGAVSLYYNGSGWHIY
jgi:hypothetical protein